VGRFPGQPSPDVPMVQRDEHDTLPPSQDPHVAEGVETPPTTWLGILGRLGPGLIIAGSIVGSGELIATTKTGAQAGIALLWLIVIGCLIKVFVQIELGRYAITHGVSTLAALDQLPGPRVHLNQGIAGPPIRANWVIWLWVLMTLCTVGQLGGIVGGVGQALAITFPMTGDYQRAIRVPSQKEFQRYLKWEDDAANGGAELAKLNERQRRRIENGQRIFREQLDELGMRGTRALAAVRRGDPNVKSLIDPYTYDDKLWAAIIALVTAAVLYVGRYNLIQHISLVLVVSFTFITVGNVIALQWSDVFHIPFEDILRGLSFGAPESVDGKNAWATALATFGIIGVGSTELIAYPYWCLEKGYGKWTGVRTDDDSWAARARGWMRVMRVDAFLSMVVYTIATVAFYMMGVAVLYREGRDPEDMRMVSTLATAYVPVFGVYAKWLFLVGAIAVLYSTFLVANAANARMVTDALKVVGLMPKDDERAHVRSVGILSVALPLTCLAVFCSGADPVRLVLIAGTMQFFFLPILAFAAIWFRMTATDSRIRPTRLWDVMLIVSSAALLLAGAYGMWSKLS
jgi:Mn2+/Fe2+ NRAMP family transporter